MKFKRRLPMTIIPMLSQTKLMSTCMPSLKLKLIQITIHVFDQIITNENICMYALTLLSIIAMQIK